MAIYYSKISGLKMPRIQTRTWVTGLALTPVLLVALLGHFIMADFMSDPIERQETAKICAKNNPGLDQILCPISNLYR